MSENNTFDGKFPLFQERLSQARGKISQGEMANRIGVDRTTYNSYETSGRTIPDIVTLKNIALALGVSADYLLGLTDAQSTDLSVRAVCDLTGLSEHTAKVLIKDREKSFGENTAPFALAFIDSLLGKAWVSNELLKTESSIIQAATVHFFQQNQDFQGVLRFSPEELRDLYLRRAAEPLQKLVMECLIECTDRIENELGEEKKKFTQDGITPNDSFQDIAFRKMIEESDRKEQDNG